MNHLEHNRNKQYVIQSTKKLNNGLLAQTTILPYKINSNGQLINSFTFAEQVESTIQTRSTSEVPTEFVDVTITVITYYAHYFSMENMSNFYRHAGIEAYWNSDNPTMNVENMLVWFDTSGDLYSYPECIDNSMEDYFIENDFFIRSEIDETHPTEGVTYIDGNNTMDFDTVVYCSDYFNHGGLIYLKMDYTVDGKSYEHDRSYYVYSK